LGSASDLFAPGDHGTTFGANPIATAAGLSVIKVLKKERLLASAKKHEKVIKNSVAKIEGVKEVRGSGLLIGIELDAEISTSVKDRLLSKGVIVNAPNPTTIRIAPALNVSKVQIERFIKLFAESLKEVQHG
jgi:acetylornithine aminotransferase